MMPRSNMDTTCFHSSENVYFEPLKTGWITLIFAGYMS